VRGGVANDDLLRTAGIEEDVEDAIVLAGKTGMEEAIRDRWRLTRSGGGRSAGEGEAEPHGVHAGERPRARVVARDEVGSLLRRTQELLELLRRVVVEAQIGGGELFLQHSGAGKQPQGGALHTVRRAHQHLTLAFEIGAGHAAIDGLRESNGAVGEPQVNVFAIDLSLANLVDPLRVETDVAQGVIERQHRAGGDWGRRRLRHSLGWSQGRALLLGLGAGRQDEQ